MGDFLGRCSTARRDEFRLYCLIPTQERSNFTEELAAAAASAAASSGSMESQEDEKNSAIEIAAGSRRRLRRINTHDGVATATLGNTASNVSICNALESNDSPDLSTPAFAVWQREQCRQDGNGTQTSCCYNLKE